MCGRLADHFVMKHLQRLKRLDLGFRPFPLEPLTLSIKSEHLCTFECSWTFAPLLPCISFRLHYAFHWTIHSFLMYFFDSPWNTSHEVLKRRCVIEYILLTKGIAIYCCNKQFKNIFVLFCSSFSDVGQVQWKTINKMLYMRLNRL